jgi:glyoxylase-like metal-dependent hydrolase (beta-lactamase superfamily II)
VRFFLSPCPDIEVVRREYGLGPALLLIWIASIPAGQEAACVTRLAAHPEDFQYVEFAFIGTAAAPESPIVIASTIAAGDEGRPVHGDGHGRRDRLDRSISDHLGSERPSIHLLEVLPNVHAVRLIGAQAFLLVDGDEITLVDAGHVGSGRILRGYLTRIGRSMEHITRIVCTHGHPDHIGGVHEIAAMSGAEVLLHPADSERLRIRLREVIANFSPGPIVALLTRAPAHARPIEDGEELPVFGGIRVLHTPGHTPGSVCLYSPEGRFVIVGDLLQRVKGKVTLPNYFFTDDMAQARRSIGRLAELDVETILFSHYPPYREKARDSLRGLAT